MRTNSDSVAQAAITALTARVALLESPTVFAVTGLSGGSQSYEVNWANGDIQTIDLGMLDSAAALTLTFTGTPKGRAGQLRITQRAATAATVIFTGVIFPGGAPTISTTDDAMDFISIFYDGTNKVGVAAQNPVA